jgi:predicted metal-dependent hydrolase
MAQKTVVIPQIGEIILSKRRGSSHIRLSINAAGKVRVGLPYWAPYSAGISFALSKADWIKKHLSAHPDQMLKNGDLIGKSHRVEYTQDLNQKITAVKISKNAIKVTSAISISSPSVQKKITSAAEKALKSQADQLLKQRLDAIAKKHGFEYKSVQTRKLTARWGSCSNAKVITLSYYLIQLPWQFIDYVIIHELIHTQHMHHGKEFWDDFKEILPNAKTLQKEIRSYKPLIQAYKIIPGK